MRKVSRSVRVYLPMTKKYCYLKAKQIGALDPKYTDKESVYTDVSEKRIFESDIIEELREEGYSTYLVKFCNVGNDWFAIKLMDYNPNEGHPLQWDKITYKPLKEVVEGSTVQIIGDARRFNILMNEE